MGHLSAVLHSPFKQDFPKPKVLDSGVSIYLGHFFPIGLGVQGCLGEQSWMLFWGNTKFIVERVVPDLVWGAQEKCNDAMSRGHRRPPERTGTS